MRRKEEAKNALFPNFSGLTSEVGEKLELVRMGKNGKLQQRQLDSKLSC